MVNTDVVTGQNAVAVAVVVVVVVIVVVAVVGLNVAIAKTNGATIAFRKWGGVRLRLCRLTNIMLLRP